MSDAEEQIVQLLKNRGVRNDKAVRIAVPVAAVAATTPHTGGPLTSLVSAAVASDERVPASLSVHRPTSAVAAVVAAAAAAAAAPPPPPPPVVVAAWSEIERYATHVQQLIREAKLRGYAPNADAHAALFNSASCLLKASHSLEPSPSSAARSMATATGLSSGRLLIDDADAASLRRRKADDDGAKRRVRKPPASLPGQACAQCKRTDSPEWRKGPDGTHSLCNACGLRFARQQAKRQKTGGAAAVVDELDDE